MKIKSRQVLGIPPDIIISKDFLYPPNIKSEASYYIQTLLIVKIDITNINTKIGCVFLNERRLPNSMLRDIE